MMDNQKPKFPEPKGKAALGDMTGKTLTTDDAPKFNATNAVNVGTNAKMAGSHIDHAEAKLIELQKNFATNSASFALCAEIVTHLTEARHIIDT